MIYVENIIKGFTLLVFFILGFTPDLVSQSQSPCYTPLISVGKSQIENGEYEKAIETFFIIYNCWEVKENDSNGTKKDNLKKLISDAQEKAIQRVESLLEMSRESEAREKKAREEAEQNAKIISSQNKKLEENSKIIREQGKQSEALRLSLLSQTASSQNNKKEAILLSFLSLKMLSEDTIPSNYEVFANAVRDTFVENIFESKIPIKKFECTFDNSACIIQTIDDQVTYVSRNSQNIRKASNAYQKTFLAVSLNDRKSIIIAIEKELILIDSLGNHSKIENPHEEAITYLSVSKDERKLLTCSRDNTASIIDLQTLNSVQLKQHRSNIYQGKFSHSNQYLFIRSADATISIWDTTGRSISLINDNHSYIYNANFSPNKDMLITTSLANGSDRIVQLWDINGNLIQSLQDSSFVKRAFFSSNGSHIVTVGKSNLLKTWDLEGKLITTLNKHKNSANTITYNHDGKFILTASKDGIAELWNKNGDNLSTLIGHREALISAFFSKDSRYILTTSKDGTAKLWDLQGNILLNLNLKSDNPIAATFSTDGNHILTVENDNLFLRKTVMPHIIYNELNSTLASKLIDIDKLKVKYRLQFIENL